MWGNSSKSKSKSKSAKIETLVGRNTEITGDIVFQGGMHVDGTVRGNILSDGDDCIVSVSQHGVVEGDVKVPHIVLDGTVTGDVYARERLELEAQAKVNGDVYYNLVEMSVGASVNGKMVHKPADRPLLLDKSADRKAVGADQSARRAGERPGTKPGEQQGSADTRNQQSEDKAAGS
jgi:cytoskeletal protein CcmA (bactofilin family)